VNRTSLAIALGLLGAAGVHLLYTAVVFGWRGLAVAPRLGVQGHHLELRARWRDVRVQAGLGDVRPRELIAVEVVLAAAGGGLAYAIWGGWLAASAAAVAGAAVPVASARSRRHARLEAARDAWPRLLEEIRLQVVTLGRPIPQALLEVGSAGPAELRPAFAAAQREWLISTELDRSLQVLKARLADPTADAVCETLLVAHEVGGADVDRRLRDLIDDRVLDLQGRKDARARQAGVRFARSFVVIVPLGMALVGLSIGDGRAAYATASGQLLVLVAFGAMAVCWVWAARLLKLPGERRVFDGTGAAEVPR
jgi:tight adherence protein B